MHTLVSLAKKTVETFINEKKIISPPEYLPKEFLEKKAGTFVTIEENGELRGCIGTYLPTRKNIAEEIIQNAIAAATEDYRFGPVQKEELPYLTYTVYILNQQESVKNIKELDPKKYGVIVKTSPIIYKSGLLLPDLEGINTVEKQIAIACQKGGINPSKEKIVIFRFTVEKFK